MLCHFNIGFKSIKIFIIYLLGISYNSVPIIIVIKINNNKIKRNKNQISYNLRNNLRSHVIFYFNKYNSSLAKNK